MNEITAVITSLRNRARKLEEFAAELERLAVNEKLSDNLPINKVVIEPLVDTTKNITVSPPSVRLEKPTKRSKTGRVLTCRGLRAGVLRYLYTGEASVAAIAHAIGIDFHKVKAVCTQLVHDSYATAEQRTTSVINKQVHTMTVYVLTDKGREEAKFFVDNPTIMIRNKQAIATSDRRTNTGNPARPN